MRTLADGGVTPGMREQRRLYECVIETLRSIPIRDGPEVFAFSMGPFLKRGKGQHGLRR